MTAEQWASLGWQVAGWLAPFVLAAILYFGGRLINAQVKIIDARRGDMLASNIEAYAVRAVQWAEKTIADNPDKKAAVMKFLQTYCDARGWKISVEKLDAIAEAQVFLLPPTHPAPPVSQAAASKPTP